MTFQKLLFVLGCSILISCAPNKFEKLTTYVDPFIGTDGHGHLYPGPVMPFGMVQLSPDTRTEGWDACGGYHYSDSTIIGFSHTHLNGTGIGDYGDILFMPFTGNVPITPGDAQNPDSGYRSRFSRKSEIAKPGYYSVHLSDYNIKVELSATNRTGFHRYTFPESNESGLIIDLHHSIYNHQNLINEIRIINDKEIEGYKLSSGWAKSQKVYFRAKFSKSFTYELFSNDSLVYDKTKITSQNVKVKLNFSTTKNEEVIAKVAISAVDYDGAKINMEAEAANNTFDEVVENSQEAWNSQLSKIKVSDKNKTNKTIFYTSLYHASLTPHLFSDADGRYLGMDQKIHKSNKPNFTIFSLWDTFRGEHPLLTIIDPEFDQACINSLLTKNSEGGLLPMWDLASNYTGTMIGHHSIPVIVDAYMKGLRNFDANEALQAMINAVTYDEKKVFNAPNNDVRIHLMPKALKYDDEFGFVPSDLEGSSVSQALEFAYNFWCIATMAREMGKTDVANRYFEKATHYKHYYNASNGFMMAKKLNGEWDALIDPRFSDHWKTPYVEGNAWQWSWYVPHNVDGLIELHGGKQPFSVKLDSLFNTSSEILGENRAADISGLIGQYAHGNEPSHHIAYLYNYADQPWKTQEIVEKIRTELYNETPSGLCGNEDCGQMSAWYVLSSLGFYPVCPGNNLYSLGKPLFEKIEIPVGADKTFTIKVNNFSPENNYVQAVYLNDKELDNQFISHNDIVEGKTLVFEMGKQKTIFWKK